MQQTIFKPVSIPCTSFYLIILSGRIQKSIRGEAADGCSPGVLAWECRGTVGVGLCGEDWERDCHGGTGMDRGIFGEGGDSPWNWIKQKKPPHFCSEGVPFVKSKIKCLFWVFYCRNGKYFYRLKRLKTLKHKENHAITRIAWLARKEGFEPSRRFYPAYSLSRGAPSATWVLPQVWTYWRREWDSNPRMLSHRRFSRPVPSTARPSLRIMSSRLTLKRKNNITILKYCLST